MPIPTISAPSQALPSQLKVPMTGQVQFEGKDIYFSEIYRFNDYPVIIAGIPDNKGELQHRLLYFSQSHCVWRVAPGLQETGRFYKGYANFSCDLPPLLNIAMMQHFGPQTQHPSQWQAIDESYIKSHFLAAKDQRKITDDSSFLWDNDAPTAFKNQTVIEEQSLLAIDFREDLITGYMQPIKINDKNRETFISKIVQNGAILPDLTTVETIETTNHFLALDNHFLNSSQIMVSTCLSFDKKIRYLFAEGTDEKTNEKTRFLLSAAHEPANINSYLVPNKTFSLGYLHTTPIIRPDDHFVMVFNTMKPEEQPTRFQIGKNKYLVLGAYAERLPFNYLLNHPDKILVLRSQAVTVAPQSSAPTSVSTPTLPTENNYHEILLEIKQFIEQNTWHNGESTVHLGHHSTVNKFRLPEPVYKQYEIINYYLDTMKKTSMPSNAAKVTFDKVCNTAVNGLSLAVLHESAIKTEKKTSLGSMFSKVVAVKPLHDATKVYLEIFENKDIQAVAQSINGLLKQTLRQRL